MNDMEPKAKIPTAPANGIFIDQHARPSVAAQSRPQAVVDIVGPTAAPDPLSTPASLTDVFNEAAALLAENAELREEVDDLKAALADTLADNEMMGRVFDADDQVEAAMAEATRHKALMENAERMLSARSHEFNERARLVVHWKNRAEKAEKQLAKAA